MTESLVRQARDGDVAIVTLNRPARHNALVPELLTALLAALDDVAAGDAQSAAVASAHALSSNTNSSCIAAHPLGVFVRYTSMK